MIFLTKEEIAKLAAQENMENGWRFISGFWERNGEIAIVFCENSKLKTQNTFVYLFYKDEDENLKYAFSPTVHYFARNCKQLIEAAANKRW